MAEPTSEIPESSVKPPGVPKITPTPAEAPLTPTPEAVPTAKPFGVPTPPESQAPVVAPSGIRGILVRIPILGRFFR